jgi:hypothetical protein
MYYYCRFYLLIVFLHAGFTEIFAQRSIISQLKIEKQEVALYSLFQLQFDAEIGAANPYSYEEVSIQAVIDGPGKIRDTIDAFYSVPHAFDKDKKDFFPIDEGHFFIRYAPTAPGRYHGKLICQVPKPGQIYDGSFDFFCTTSDARGFIRRSESNYFCFDNKESYLPIGENANLHETNYVADYTKWIDSLSAYNANFIRVWMIKSGSGIEWKKDQVYEGLQNYQQRHAARLDWLLDYGLSKQVYVMLLLYSTGNEKSSVNPGWSDNPFNEKNGGPCIKQGEIFSKPKAITIIQNRLRYIIARYGWHPAIMAWELYNEIDGVPDYLTYRQDIRKWVYEMSNYIKKKDVNNHLVTLSYSNENEDTTVWHLPSIDISQTHVYRNDIHIERTIASLSTEYIRAFSKPHFTGEFGIDAENIDLSRVDPTGIYFHNTIWASALSGACGAAATYWWQNYIDAQNLYHHFRSLSDFLYRQQPDKFQFLPADCKVIGLPTSDIVLKPSGGWKEFAPEKYSISGNGSLIPRERRLNVFLHGKGLNARWMKPVNFEVNYPVDGFFAIQTGKSNAATGILSISVDGKEVLVQNNDTSGRDFSIPISAGTRLITVENKGWDWIGINEYRFGRAQGRLHSYVLTAARRDRAVGYLLNSNFNWQTFFKHQPLTEIPAGGKLEITNMKNGNYTVRFYNCLTGELLHTKDARANNDTVFIELPAISWDIAFELLKR